jgi:hypothetical protein
MEKWCTCLWKTLSTELGQSGYNLVFLKIDPSKRSQVLAEIENKLSGTNLEVVELTKF